MAVVVVALDGRIFDCPVHPLDLPIRPGVLYLGKAVLDAIVAASHVEHVRHVARRRPICVAGREGELDAVVGENGVDLVRHGLDQSSEEGRCGCPACLPDQLHESKFAGAINGDIEKKLAPGGLHLGNVDVEISDRISPELLLVRLVALHIRQLRNAMALKAAMQGRPGQVRDGRLQRVKAVIERKQRVLAESHDDRLLLDRQHS